MAAVGIAPRRPAPSGSVTRLADSDGDRAARGRLGINPPGRWLMTPAQPENTRVEARRTALIVANLSWETEGVDCFSLERPLR